MNIDPLALLALISELYQTTAQQQDRIQQLERELATTPERTPDEEPCPASP